MVKKLPLDLTKLAQFAWKVYGGKGDSGTVAIDNVYLLKGPAVANNAVFPTKKSAAIVSSYNNRIINVSLER